jgi:hypothetical protein
MNSKIIANFNSVRTTGYWLGFELARFFRIGNGADPLGIV